MKLPFALYVSAFISDDASLTQPVQSPGSSAASSRDASPSRDSPFAGSLKPAVTIKRGPRGYGFTLKAIRVYYYGSDYYTLHHLIVVSDN